MTFYEKNKIKKIFKKHNIDFTEEMGIVEIKDNQDLGLLPNKKVIKILGLKNDKGHLCLISKLNEIEKLWLNIFFKYYKYYEVYNDNGEIIKSNFYILIYEILDGLE
jgi:hypothetical protein